jgi:light-regulated signal transduction histidine kinase (bacteriophytochrome)
MSTVLQPEIDLDRCAQEPIRIPGGIQPHGAMLVVDPATLVILQLSANSAQVLGQQPTPGAALETVCGAPFASEIRNWLSSSDPLFLRTATFSGRNLQALAHRTSQGAIIEFEEPPRSEGDTLEALYPRIAHFMEEAQNFASVDEVCAAAAREFRRIAKFNRVLIYRFDADWNGEVLAEDGDGVLPSYLGLRFPASDIPAQARELYRLNRLRLIPDANYQPVSLEPALSPLDNAPLDMSFAALRSVSPVHLEYMRNMGTLASMSVSLIVDGKLWGLASCHNATPHRVNAQSRSVCDLLGKVLSQQISARDRNAYAARRIELKKIEGELLAHLATSDSLQQGLRDNASLWLALTGATGAAILHDEQTFVTGDTPAPERVRELAALLQQRGEVNCFATDTLSAVWPQLADIAPQASGLLAIAISQIHASYVMWFRPEVARTIEWAGDPRKPAEPGTDRLHPRVSFATWREQVRGRAEPWSAAEVDAAQDFRNAIINVVLRRAEERAELTGQLQRSNRELESFSYSVSHDLRAPFRHIVGYTQLLRDSEMNLAEKSRHYLDSIVEAAATAGQLVDDLLSFSHLGRTSLSFAAVDMNKLLQEVRRTLEPDFRDRTIEWQIGILPPSWGDAALLRQALINLVSNALKYTRHRASAVITISGNDGGTLTTYEVRDNGVGFDMAYVHKLFGVFQRLHRMEDFEGTGIGLALTKRIVERHGGWIKAQGSPDQGAVFTFGLPKRERGGTNG